MAATCGCHKAVCPESFALQGQQTCYFQVAALVLSLTVAAQPGLTGGMFEDLSQCLLGNIFCCWEVAVNPLSPHMDSVKKTILLNKISTGCSKINEIANKYEGQPAVVQIGFLPVSVLLMKTELTKTVFLQLYKLGHHVSFHKW